MSPAVYYIQSFQDHILDRAGILIARFSPILYFSQSIGNPHHYIAAFKMDQRSLAWIHSRNNSFSIWKNIRSQKPCFDIPRDRQLPMVTKHIDCGAYTDIKFTTDLPTTTLSTMMLGSSCPYPRLILEENGL